AHAHAFRGLAPARFGAGSQDAAVGVPKCEVEASAGRLLLGLVLLPVVLGRVAATATRGCRSGRRAGLVLAREQALARLLCLLALRVFAARGLLRQLVRLFDGLEELVDAGDPLRGVGDRRRVLLAAAGLGRELVEVVLGRRVRLLGEIVLRGG